MRDIKKNCSPCAQNIRRSQKIRWVWGHTYEQKGPDWRSQVRNNNVEKV